jgi:chemotaxis protein CheX
MLLLPREAVDQISDPCNLDASVEEVCALVMGCRCSRIAEVEIREEKSLMAVVGFGGVLSGACVLRCGAHAAVTMAGRMMSEVFSEMDTTVQDAMGEVCNMLAGGWKGRIPALASACSLSVPAVITGGDYQIRVHTPQYQMHRSYCFDDVRFHVQIVCEGLK